MHKYMCNQITKHNSALYFGLQAFFQLPLPFYLFLSFCTQCVGQHVERIPCTALTSQPTLSNAVCRLQQEGFNRTNIGSTGQPRLYSPAKQIHGVPTGLNVQMHLQFTYL